MRCLNIALLVQPTAKLMGIHLHAFWDGIIISTQNIGRLGNEATALRNRTEFARDNRTKPESRGDGARVYEGHEIARKIVYRNGALRGTPKGTRLNCNEVADAASLPAGYARIAGSIGDRRIVLAGYRLADLLKRITVE